jgi:hypothetical protein
MMSIGNTQGLPKRRLPSVLSLAPVLAIIHHGFLNHRVPSVRGSGDDLPTAAKRRPQHSIFATHRQVEHANRYPYLIRYGVLI